MNKQLISTLDKIATLISSFFGGYWLFVLLDLTRVNDTAISATFLWLIIIAILRILK